MPQVPYNFGLGSQSIGTGPTWFNSAADEVVNAGAGADVFNYVMGAPLGNDHFIGGTGVDTLNLYYTLSQWQSGTVALLSSFLQNAVATAPKPGGQVAPGTTWLPALNFGALGSLQVSEMEVVNIYIDNVLFTGNFPVVNTSPVQLGTVTEDAVPDTATGTISWTDNDLAQVHNTKVIQGLYGTLSLSGFTDPVNAAAGSVNWTYDLDSANGAVNSLNAGQTLTDNVVVEVDDGMGSKISVPITITINGVTDLSFATSGTVVEAKNGPGASLAVINPGTSPITALYPLNALPGDPVGAGDIPANATWFVNTPLVGSVNVVDTPNPDPLPIPLNELGQGGVVGVPGGGLTFVGNQWTYTLDNVKANPLAGGQNVVLPFSLSAQWTVGSTIYTVVRPLTITVQGTNDESTMVRLTPEDLTVTENGGKNNASLSLDPAAGGNIDIVDPDGDYPGAAFATKYGNIIVDTAGKWTYTVDESKTDPIPAGQTVIDSITVSHDGASVVLPVTITGADDLPTAIFIVDTVAKTTEADSPTELVGAARATHYDFEVSELGGLNNTKSLVPDSGNTAGGKFRMDDPDTPQLFKALSNTPLDGLGNRVDDTSTIGKYGTFALDVNTGVWSYTLNNKAAATEALDDGDSVTERLLVQDPNNPTITNAVTVTIYGQDDLVQLVEPDPIATQDYKVNEWGFEGTKSEVVIDEVAVGDVNAFDPDDVGSTFGANGSRVVTGVGDTAAYVATTGMLQVKGQYGYFTLDPISGKWSYSLKEFTPKEGGAPTIAAFPATNADPLSVPATDNEGLDWFPVSQDTNLDKNFANDVDFRNAEEIKGGDQRFETMTIFSDASGTPGASFTVTVTIQGYEDPAFLIDSGLPDDKSTTERGGLNNNLPGDLTAGGDVTSKDVDVGDTGWQTPGGKIAGKYGEFTFTPDNAKSTATWSYVLNDTLPAVDSLLAGQTLIDTLSLISKDGTPQSIPVTINGVNDIATLVFNGPQDNQTKEAGGVNNTTPGDPIAGGDMDITDPDAGQNQIAPPVVVNTAYGKFTIDPTTGKWDYLLDDTKAATQALDPLVPGQESAVDSIVVYSVDNTASLTLSVTIIGATDIANLVNTYDENLITVPSDFDNIVDGAPGGNFDDLASGTVHQPPILAPGGVGPRVDFNAIPPAKFTGSFGTWTQFDVAGATKGDWAYDLNEAGVAYKSLAPGQTQTDTLVVQETATGGLFNVTVQVVGINEVPDILAPAVINPDGTTTFTAKDYDPGSALRLTVEDIVPGPLDADRDLGPINNGSPTNYAVPTAPSSIGLTLGDLYASDNVSPPEPVGKDTFLNVVIGQGTTGGDDMTARENASRIGGLFKGYGGNDTIGGTTGTDWMDGGDDNDTMRGNAGNDTMYGGNGLDTMGGGNNNDLMYGEANDDLMGGEGGDDSMEGGAGNDGLGGGSGNDTMNGGEGNDIMDEFINGSTFVIVTFVGGGGTGNDVMNGGNGNDTMEGGADNDSMDGGNDNDLMFGDGGLVFPVIGGGNDTLNGGNGNDTLVGDSGNDSLAGGEGDDNVDGGVGNDSITGDGGNDTVSGGLGNDTMSGGAGNDVISGGGQTDTFRGETGNDTLTGSAGDRDFYEFTHFGAANVDTIVNAGFNLGVSAGTGDRILIPNTWVGNSLLAGANTNVWWKVMSGTPSNASIDFDDRMIYDDTTSTLYYDQDGSGGVFNPEPVAIIGTQGVAITQNTDLTFLFQLLP